MKLLLSFFLLTALPITSLGVVADSVTPNRPLFLVPGIIGSTLEENGKVIWGDVYSLAKSRFEKLDLLPERGEPAHLIAGKSVERVSMLFGLIEFDVYDRLIEFLEKELNYKRGKDLFVFAYDWRRTNFANAKRLNDFINTHATSESYDLIAHSMGGIITRIMLDERGLHPDWPCVKSKFEHPELKGVRESKRDRLCNTLYGPTDVVEWPTDQFKGPFSAAPRLHTFVELAVPHQGSVNVVGSFFEGWGALSRLLTGGMDTIRSVLLSMPAPLELAPTYENCCARGKAGAGSSNLQLDDPLAFSFWTKEILRLSDSPCPYHRCDMRRNVAVAALISRATIRKIMDAGIPRSVKAHYTIVGRDINNTRETFYISPTSTSGPPTVSYRMTADGDGTVHSISAAAPESKGRINTIAAARTKHSVIFDDEGVRQQLKWIILRPLETKVEPVSGEQFSLAGRDISDIGVDVVPRIALRSDTVRVSLVISSVRKEPFSKSRVAEQSIEVAVSDAATDETVAAVPLNVNYGSSDLENGRLVFSGVFQAPPIPNVYQLDFQYADRADTSVGDVSFSKAQFHVIEGEIN